MKEEKQLIALFKSAYSGNDYSLGKFQQANPDARQRFLWGSNQQRCPSINLGVTNGHYVFKKSWYGDESKQRLSAKDFASQFGGRIESSGATWFAVVPNNNLKETIAEYLKIAKSLS